MVPFVCGFLVHVLLLCPAGLSLAVNSAHESILIGVLYCREVQ